MHDKQFKLRKAACIRQCEEYEKLVHLGVVDEALSISSIGWKLASACLFETLNNGLQMHSSS